MMPFISNQWRQGFRKISSEIDHPKSVFCISAHWETRGTIVTDMIKPRTIHDFGGFPRELYEVQYPAPGNPDIAREIRESITTKSVHLDMNWELDHGAWSVIKHMYPKADVPVMHLSLDHTKRA